MNLMERIVNAHIASYLNILTDKLTVDRNNFLMIKHNNSFDIKEDMIISNLAGYDGGAQVLYHEFSGFAMLEAYEPFLAWAALLYRESPADIEEFLEDCHVYELHKSIFRSYFIDGICHRTDEPVLSEIGYEKGRFLDSLVNIFIKLAERRPLLFVLNKLHMAGKSTYDFLLKLAGHTGNKNIAILSTCNELFDILPYMVKVREQLDEEYDEQGRIIEWPFNAITLPSESGSVFLFRLEETDHYVEQLNAMYNTLAFEQALYYLNIIYQKIELEKLDIDVSFKFKILSLYTIVSILNEDFSYALLLCDTLKDVQNQLGSFISRYGYYYLMALAQTYSGHQEEALMCADACYTLASLEKKDYYRFKAELLKNMAYMSGWKDIWLCQTFVPVEQSLLEECEQYKYFNHLAHLYVYSFDNDIELFRSPEHIDERLVHFQKGIDIATAIGNDCFLMEAYRKNVMITSNNGFFQLCSYFYGKSMEIAVANKNEKEQANIYNGLGYNCCSWEQYDQANEYFNKALVIYSRYHMCDYIVETLYNMAVNAMLAEAYETAYQYLLAISRILKILKTNSLRVCNISKLFELTGLCCYRLGISYNIQIYLNSSGQFLDHILNNPGVKFQNNLWDDDLFLYHFISGLLEINRNNYEKALECFDQATEYVERSIGSAFFNYHQYILERARVLRLLGRDEEAEQELLKCLAFCRENNYVRKGAMIEEALEGRTHIPADYGLKLTDITLDDIMKLVRNEGIKKELKEQKDNIQFLAIWQKLISHPEKPSGEIIESAVMSFRNHFKVDKVLFIQYVHGKPCVRYSDLRFEITDETLKELERYFNENRTGFATSKLSANYYEYNEILSMFRANKIFSLVGAPIFENERLSSIFIAYIKIKESWNSPINKYVMDEDDLNIFLYVFRQLLDALDKHESHNQIKRMNDELKSMNSRLQSLASTDNLTGLLNREGYYEKTSAYLSKVKRTGIPVSFSIMYADLDNFKYYNDTFGHHVGDAVIIAFAKIFAGVSEGRGYAIRFGGDEFVLLLDTANRLELTAIAERVYALIEEQDGFTELVEEIVNKPVVIPDHHRASCSFGIAVGDEITADYDISEVMKKADAALYQVKKSGKGTYMFWKDMEQY